MEFTRPKIISDRDACNGATRVRRDPIPAFDLQNPGIGQMQPEWPITFRLLADFSFNVIKLLMQSGLFYFYYAESDDPV